LKPTVFANGAVRHYRWHVARAVPFLLALALAPSAQAAAPTVQAHRGGPVLAGVPTFPEETLPAFRNAAQNLQVVLELDAKLTADRVPVVIHDPTLDRTTNCEGPVADRTLAELEPCMADVLGAPGNDLDTAPAPEPVPIATLAEVLAFAKAEGIDINLEIKNYPTDSDYDPTPAFANRIMDVVLESGIPASQVIMQSFTPDNLDVAESRMPDAEFALLTLAGFEEPGVDFAAARGWDWVSPSWPVDEAYVERAHANNLKVVPYTINQAEDVAEAAKVGVDALITDDPLMALQTLDTQPARVGIEPLARKLAKVRRKRKLPLRVSSNEPATTVLIARLRRKVVGRRSVTFDEAGSRRVVIRISRAGKRATKGKDAVKIRLVAKTTDLALNRGTARVVARLR
jgi:glycerophosphoryl diester phosphodiesterase